MFEGLNGFELVDAVPMAEAEWDDERREFLLRHVKREHQPEEPVQAFQI